MTNESLPKDQQAQCINDFFANIGSSLDAKFGSNIILPKNNKLPQGDKLNIDGISQPEVLKLVSTISVYKSSGIEDVSSRVLKNFLELANREITALYNNVLNSGIFPDKWKIATVTPIPKVPHASNPTDLRPISLLPVPGKLLEKYITTKIESYLEGKNFFTDSQNGFRKGRSTADAMSSYLDALLDDLNKAKTGLAVYLDVRKAFDTINHKILMAKLEGCGMGAGLCKLLENYLSNRKQRTKLNNVTSDLRSVTTGVPQGSTVGPVMFIIYINDLANTLNHARSFMYADDTVIYCADLESRVARKHMQLDLNRVQEWCQDNRLSLNVSKTKVMSFMSDHKRKRCPKFKLYMCGNVIDEVENYKYLGTTLDNRLNGDAQCSKTMQLLGMKIRTFSRIRNFLSTNAALTVYKSTILPLLDYNDHFQMLWNTDKLKRLQKLQNWALRVVYCNRLPKLDEAELHSEANLLMLRHRRALHLLVSMYHRSSKPHFLDKRDIATRQFDKIKFKVINPVIKKAFKSPCYLGAQLWDLLPRETQTAPSTISFKQRIKRHVAAGLFDRVLPG